MLSVKFHFNELYLIQIFTNDLIFIYRFVQINFMFNKDIDEYNYHCDSKFNYNY